MKKLIDNCKNVSVSLCGDEQDVTQQNLGILEDLYELGNCNDNQNQTVTTGAGGGSESGQRRKRQAGLPPHLQQQDDNHWQDQQHLEFEQPADVALEWQFLQKFMSLNDTLRQIIGHQFTDFVKECTFRGETCLNET